MVSTISYVCALILVVDSARPLTKGSTWIISNLTTALQCGDYYYPHCANKAQNC